jgi:LysM repeat protein
MIRRYIPTLVAIFVLSALLCGPAAAKEDTAQISLKKTAVSKQNLRTYTVKKGDVISAIIRRIPGITAEDIPDNYRIVKKLNPDIENLNKLYPGQVLILPGKDPDGAGEKNDQTTLAASATPDASAGEQIYTVRKGDSLIRIIQRDLKIKADMNKTLRLVQSLNPHIVNVNKIYTGQIIKLPGRTVFIRVREEGKPVELPLEQAKENQTPQEKIINVTDKKEMPQETRMAVIKQVVSELNASVLSTGNYYLPLPGTGQVTIDCTKIPVIEFNDKTTVFLDWENLLNDNLKKMIRDSWASFHIVKVDKKDDVIAVLKKIFAATRSYTMARRDIPATAGSLPPLNVFLDWTISPTNLRKQAQPFMQGLRLVSGDRSLLPKAVKDYARKNSLIVTEIDEETGITGKPEELYSLSPLPVFPAKTAKDFSAALMNYLGFAADRDVDIKVFDMAKDGFNLSIKADVLVKNNGTSYIIYSSNLPQQFINVLRKARYELIFITGADSPNKMMEKILGRMAVPYASGYFTFSGTDKNQTPYTFGFAGTKIKTGKDHYIIDFDIDQGLRGLIGESWSADIARY